MAPDRILGGLNTRNECAKWSSLQTWKWTIRCRAVDVNEPFIGPFSTSLFDGIVFGGFFFVASGGRTTGKNAITNAQSNGFRHSTSLIQALYKMCAELIHKNLQSDKTVIQTHIILNPPALYPCSVSDIVILPLNCFVHLPGGLEGDLFG